jgi:hypothetical protein
MTTTTATQKLVNMITKRPATAQQIVERCGFASKSSVTSVIASLRANGVKVRDAGPNRDGFTRYSLS